MGSLVGTLTLVEVERGMEREVWSLVGILVEVWRKTRIGLEETEPLAAPEAWSLTETETETGTETVKEWSGKVKTLQRCHMRIGMRILSES